MFARRQVVRAFLDGLLTERGTARYCQGMQYTQTPRVTVGREIADYRLTSPINLLGHVRIKKKRTK